MNSKARKNVSITLYLDTIKKLKEIQEHHDEELAKLGLIGSCSQSAILEKLIINCHDSLIRGQNDTSA